MNRPIRFIQPIKCMFCHRNTTDYDVSAVQLAVDIRTKECVCRACQTEGEIENEHADGYHKANLHSQCLARQTTV